MVEIMPMKYRRRLSAAEHRMEYAAQHVASALDAMFVHALKELSKQHPYERCRVVYCDTSVNAVGVRYEVGHIPYDVLELPESALHALDSAYRMQKNWNIGVPHQVFDYFVVNGVVDTIPSR